MKVTHYEGATQSGPELDPEFDERTTADYAAWCKGNYHPDVLHESGMASLHGLWAWQAQEKRLSVVTAAPAEPTALFTQTAKRLQHCAIATSNWLAEGCDVHDIPKPEIALVAWTKETIAEALALESKRKGKPDEPN